VPSSLSSNRLSGTATRQWTSPRDKDADDVASKEVDRVGEREEVERRRRAGPVDEEVGERRPPPGVVVVARGEVHA
jgi:hypothetical protein